MAFSPERTGSLDVPVRLLTVVLGIWLVLSAFAWPHDSVELWNTWVVGAVSAILALIAIAVPPVRFANTALAVWLFVSAFALHHGAAGTVWNNVLVAVAIFFVSLVPPEGERAARPPIGPGVPSRLT